MGSATFGEFGTERTAGTVPDIQMGPAPAEDINVLRIGLKVRQLNSSRKES